MGCTRKLAVHGAQRMGVKKKSQKASRGTVWACNQARGVFIARVADAAERKRTAEMNCNQAARRVVSVAMFISVDWLATT